MTRWALHRPVRQREWMVGWTWTGFTSSRNLRRFDMLTVGLGPWRWILQRETERG